MPENFIRCAAVKTTDESVHLGKRHPDCFVAIGVIGWIRYHLGSTQGFIDKDWNFLTRSKAYKVAKEANQLIKDTGSRGVLYSEDLY